MLSVWTTKENQNKLLEALKKPSQMKQVQKDFLAVEKQHGHEAKKVVP